MCLAVPVKIVEIINEQMAVIDAGGIRREINIVFIEEPKIGDYVLVHAGCAIKKLDEKEAQEFFELVKDVQL